ncbi:MAG: hypothetical protein LH473_03495 [Chitinophagales bacterium]|nr:hypothetical protein [Chitinophagales bacterium]
MLLIRISNEAYTEKRELLQLNFIYQNKSTQEFEASEQMQGIEKERHRKEFMIAGEGTVFLIILVVMTFMVNRSLNRELKVMRQQKNFLLSITHELRSPIASSKISMQTLLKHRQLPPEKYESLLHNAVSDMDRLQLLVENLLLAAKIEDHTFRIENEACNLSAIATHVLQKTEEQFGSVRKFESSISPAVIVAVIKQH